MTIAEMRTLLGLGPEVSDAAVADAYAAYLDVSSPSAPVSVSPLTLAMAKEQLNVIGTVDDALITRLIAAAVDHVERTTGLVLSRRQVVEHASGFGRSLALRAWPIASIDAVSYRDTSNVPQILDGTAYWTNSGSRPVHISPIRASGWPLATVGRGAISVTMTAGYAEANDVPATVIQALSVIVAEFYANREAGALSADADRSIRWLLRHHKLKTL